MRSLEYYVYNQWTITEYTEYQNEVTENNNKEKQGDWSIKTY